MNKIRFEQAHAGNFRPAARTPADIQYLVIHNTMRDGETARETAAYFARAQVAKSAHYFVDAHGVWQSVRDADLAWHCGTRGMYFHPYCRNANSIGIALCSAVQAGRYVFRPQTVHNAAALTRRLMEQYGIPPERVVRHYDVTHKTCPVPFVENAAAWQAFRTALGKIRIHKRTHGHLMRIREK